MQRGRFTLLLVAVAAALCIAASAIPVDPVAWTTSVNNSQVVSALQWTATSATGGAVVVINGNGLSSIDPTTGAVLWTVTHADLDPTQSVFAVSSQALVVACRSAVFGFTTTSGAFIGKVEVHTVFTAVLQHQGMFVFSNGDALSVFAADLTERYTQPKNGDGLNAVGATSDFVYFTTLDDSFSASSSSGSGFQTFLVVVSTTTWAEQRFSDVMTVSTTGVDDHVTVIFNSVPSIGYLNLRTGMYTWKNTKLVHEMENSFSFSFVASSIAPLVVTDSNIFALDITSGDEVWRSQLLGSVANPMIVEARLVYVAGGSGEPTSLVSVDLTTGVNLANITTPALSTPVMAVAGDDIVMTNGQGYTRINIKRFDVVSYNLNLPGTSAVAVVRGVPAAGSTTIALVGLVGVSGVVLGH